MRFIRGTAVNLHSYLILTPKRPPARRYPVDGLFSDYPRINPKVP
jgi:hypothetical protein